jgi:dipeptidyl aminopeptidase/acylaminoacyl peptidase
MRAKTKHFLMIILIAIIAAGCATGPTHPALRNGRLPYLIPARLFHLSGHGNLDYQISPDGKKLAWIAKNDSRTLLGIRRIETDDHKFISTRSSRSISSYAWLQDSRRLFYTMDHDGNGKHHIYLVDSQHPNRKPLDLISEQDTLAFVHQVIRSDPDHILIYKKRGNEKNFSLYKVDLNTYEHTMIAENPGRVIYWITDQEGSLRARVKNLSNKKQSLELLGPSNRKWKTLIIWRRKNTVRFLGFTPDETGMWLLSNRGRDRISLIRLNLKTGNEELVYEDPKVDVDNVVLSQLTGKPVMAFSNPDYPRTYFFDPDWKNDLSIFDGNKPFGLYLTSMDREERLLGFSVYSDKADDFYIYNRETGEKIFIYERPISVYSEALASVEPVAFRSRDGLEINGFLTLPNGISANKLPMVLLVHGGPWARDYWHYDSLVQFLANRGYAVFQINFRGSTGYGRAFTKAAINEFAGKMQDDLADGVQWAVKKGIADPGHIAILGASYGGYAALVGLAFTPHLFACGVDLSGPSNLVSLLEPESDFLKAETSRWPRYVGDPEKLEERRNMKGKSPLFRVDQIARPLLIFHGADDKIVKQRESDQIVAALRAKGKEVEYFVFQNEGHGFVHWKNVSIFFAELEEFLAKHLGGRSAGYH